MRICTLSVNRRGHRGEKEIFDQADNKSFLSLLRELRGTKTFFLFAIRSFLIVIISSSSAHAFYQWQGEKSDLELRGLIRLFGAVSINPEDTYFYDERSEVGAGEIARLIMQAHTGEKLGFELNIFQAYIPEALLSQGNLASFLDVERSSALSWNLKDGAYAPLAIDRLNARITYNRLDFILGRQPINLATTYYFTPNDFFAPFAAQSFYRLYKPGVDAARAEVRLGDLSQLSLVSVLGYNRDPTSDTGWSDSPEGSRTSYVARASTVLGDFEWAVVGGTVREEDIIGGSFQGELFGWLGLRAEGHRSEADTAEGDRATEAVVGFEHKWENSLNLRLEQFYHGSGADAVSGYAALLTPPRDTAYLGRNYTAFGVGYEFTPLLNGEFLTLFNWTDYSTLLTGNAVYSLSDESEISFIVSIPVGKKPEGQDINSEFGLYPYSLNIEVRAYF